MIKLSPEASARRSLFLDIAKHVLSECPAEKLMKGVIKASEVKNFKRVVVISIGKAARPMVKAILPLLGREPDQILIADKGHPFPSERGIRVTKKIMTTARDLGEHDLAIVLLSGGGSAMFTAPVPEITLEDKIATTRALLRCGATIQEINIVRKHLSQVKGGGLAALLHHATVCGFVISDVVGNDLSTIASGPLTPDPTTFTDALHVIKKYKLRVPASVRRYLEKGPKNPLLETPKPGSRYFTKVTTKIVADHMTTAKKALEKANAMKIKVIMLKEPITGEARHVAEKLLLPQAKKNTLLIACGETTVNCKGNGYGGRNQEVVLGALKHLSDDQTILSIGTDGVDGMCPENVAGAIGDVALRKAGDELKLSIADYLRRNDSYCYFKQTHGLIKTGRTGTNLGDLMLLMVGGGRVELPTSTLSVSRSNQLS